MIPPQLTFSLACLSAALLITGCTLFEDEAQKKVKYFLKDPGSAEFRNAKKVKSPGAETDTAYCGEVNSKNSYGAFSGFERYIVDGRLVLLERNGEAFYDQMDGGRDWTDKAVRDAGITAAKMTFLKYKITADVANQKEINAQKRAGREPTTAEKEANTPFNIAWKDYCE